jgi:hypothetical protein
MVFLIFLLSFLEICAISKIPRTTTRALRLKSCELPSFHILNYLKPESTLCVMVSKKLKVSKKYIVRLSSAMTIAITRCLEVIRRPEFQITRKHNVSETESVSVLRRGEGDPYLWGPLERPNLNQNYGVYGLCPSSGIQNRYKAQRFGNWICFSLAVRAGSQWSS